jgi:putative monooxygenase ydhR
MSQQILQVNMNFSIPAADLEAAWLGVAQPLADVPGLIWKVWLMNEERKEAGGIYLFETADAARAYVEGPIVVSLKASPVVSNITGKMFDVLTDHSAVTRAPLNAVVAG